MNNISYFCIVKRFTSILAVLISALVMPAYAHKELGGEAAHHVDSVITIGLLTCQPGNEVYSLYGHTAIHYVNLDQGIDVAVNYGIFNFNKPFFVGRFVLGLTDYEMGVQDFNSFCALYASEGRGVTEQVLDIPPNDKLLFAHAIERNYRPENREYRYNYFYDNCTTRARDMVLGRLKPLTQYRRTDQGPSFREMIHQCNEDRPWARFGNDMLLGVGADRPTSVGDQQFLPNNLMEDFATATIPDAVGNRIPLVSETLTHVSATRHRAEREFVMRPSACAIVLLFITFIITIFEFFSKRKMWFFDLLVAVVSGLAGCILFVMLFSQHPTVRVNLQLLALNPLPLVVGWRAISRWRHGERHWWWPLQTILLVIFLIAGIAGFQHYAEGMYALACCLLLRSGIKCRVKTVK